VELRYRRHGPDVWVFRAREIGEDGNERRPAVDIGDVTELPSKAAALERVEELGLIRQFNFNRIVRTFNDLVAKYKKEVWPTRFGTQGAYAYSCSFLEARWGESSLTQMAKSPMEIHVWLNGLEGKEGNPLAKGTRQHVLSLLHAMFDAAMGWGLIPKERNPIDFVSVKKGANKKERKTKLTPEQFQFMMKDPDIPLHVKVICAVAALTGLRISEVLGLDWETSIDFVNKKVNIVRSYTCGRVDDPKTDNSKEPVPMSEQLEHILCEWKEAMPVIGGWLFGSIITERPFSRSTLQQKHLRPALFRAGLSEMDLEGTGFHCFRHSYRAWLGDLDAALEVQKALMRHGSIRQTLEYGKNSTKQEEKRRKTQQSLADVVVGKNPA
jgi:integrase